MTAETYTNNSQTSDIACPDTPPSKHYSRIVVAGIDLCDEGLYAVSLQSEGDDVRLVPESFIKFLITPELQGLGDLDRYMACVLTVVNWYRARFNVGLMSMAPWLAPVERPLPSIRIEWARACEAAIEALLAWRKKESEVPHKT
jgi:hypothetical protein